MTENVLPDENEVKKDNTNKMETEKKSIREIRYEFTNCFSVYTVFRNVFNKTKMLNATVRYATRITTESSHLHHKVQGFHTQNNNSNNHNEWCWLGKKRGKTVVESEKAPIVTTLLQNAPCVPKRAHILSAWIECWSETEQHMGKNNNINSGYAEKCCMLEFLHALR